MLTLNVFESAHLLFYLPSYTTHPSQYSHINNTQFAHVLLLNLPIFSSIGHSWYNRCPKVFLQSCWYARITKHSKSKNPLQPLRSYAMLDIFLNLSILTNFEPRYQNKSLYVISWYSILVQVSLSALCTSPLKLQCIYFVFVWLALKPLDSKTTCHLSNFTFMSSFNSSTNTISYINNIH